MSVALCEDDKIISQKFGDDSKKHLETLMPCVSDLLKSNNVSLDDIDLFAVSIGPGSFTGIRIGASAVSAMAQVKNKSVVCVDTLKALCANVEFDGAVCAMIDARRNEAFYCVLQNGEVIIKSAAGPVAELLDKIKDKKVMFVGDGVSVYRSMIEETCKDAYFAEGDEMLQMASSVCKVGYDMYKNGEISQYDELSPEYLRLSQAERVKLESKA